MRWWHKTLLTSLVLMLLLLATGYWYLQKTLAALPVQNLHYEVKALSLHQLQLSHVSFNISSADVHVQLNDVTVSWLFPGWFSLALDHVQLGNGNITLTTWPQADTSTADTATPAFSLPENWQLPAILPGTVSLQQLGIHLPCGQSRCSYQLQAELSIVQQKLQYQLTVADAASTDTYNADAANSDITRLSLSGDYQAIQNLPLLNAQLTLDDSAWLTLSQQLSAQDGVNASGELKLDIAPPSPWLLQQFKLWQIELPADALTQFTAPVTLQSNWQLALPEHLSLASLSQQASGTWQLSANLPTPLSLPGIGQLQGTVAAKLGLEQGELSQYQLNSQLTLLKPQLSGDLLQLGLNADAVHITVNADGKNQPQLNALPLQIALTSEGKTALGLTGNAILNLTPPMSAQLQQARLSLKQQLFNPAPDTKLGEVQLNSEFNAYWLADSWQLDVQQLTADIATLSAPSISGRNIKLSISPGQFSGDSRFNQVKLHSDIKLSASELAHPQLKPQSWQWQSKLSGELNNLVLDGHISNAASLGLTHQLTYQHDKLKLNWQLDDMFLLAGNPLAATLTAWPALLEFNRGRIASSGELTLLPAVSASAKVNFSGVSGIYDRSLFKELTAALQLKYQADAVQLATTDATVAEIEHGVVVGPLKLNAQYNATADAITAGKLDIQQLQLLAMGGQVQVEPVLLDLSLAEQQLLLQLKQIDLTQLLQQHPTTDLSGNGRISGTIPLLLGRNGASVKDGSIAAESPGGKLQYRPPTAQSMAASNQGMKVVLEALDDFHYSVLSSNVSYDTSGKLLLGLTLKGQNPALEAGRAINLNINLEEDIPALITSLQLSSKISDKIKQRVQQRLQQSGAKRANGVQP
ncbi:intermembrane phospholipid transport protein YdbH family protein [Rheinheimera hassiensis]|uniref:intermembrane phospholipid transport protein YdbH family protein n=1 Tax=Rheinheimera hassiensis TaxID=1193627 RepID=UPI001F070F3E|nr:YdbH domain-containing protein [Rheinheimera hassiensis]